MWIILAKECAKLFLAVCSQLRLIGAPNVSSFMLHPLDAPSRLEGSAWH